MCHLNVFFNFTPLVCSVVRHSISTQLSHKLNQLEVQITVKNTLKSCNNKATAYVYACVYVQKTP